MRRHDLVGFTARDFADFPVSGALVNPPEIVCGAPTVSARPAELDLELRVK